MNPDPKDKEMDIIDQAMVADDYDYGDTPEVNDEEDAGDDAPLQKEPIEKAGSVPEVPAKKEQGVPPGQGSDPQNPLGLKRVGAQFADGKGNIVDKDGKILARSGEAARLWQEASRATAQVSNLTRQLERVTQERQRDQQLINNAKEIAELPSKLGISKEDYNEGITLLSNWARDPVGVAREIVARAMALGYNASDILGKNVGDAVEMKALTQLMKTTTAPLKKQQDDAAAATEAETKSRQAYQNFIDTYENAEVHGEAIANLMQKGRTPVDAYYQVRMFALENGLDFSQPLGPQIDARRRGQNGQRDTGRRPLDPGNGRGNESQMTNKPAMANADDDWGTILKGVMAEE